MTIDRDRIFPTKDLLDHVPQLIDEIAVYVGAPERAYVSQLTDYAPDTRKDSIRKERDAASSGATRPPTVPPQR